MYSDPDRTVLLPTAVPTNLVVLHQNKRSQLLVLVCFFHYLNIIVYFISIIYFMFFSLGLLSPNVSYSADCSISSSTQTTQILSLHTPRKKKYRAELREMKNKFELLEQKMNALTQEVATKNCANAIDVTSVELFNRVVEAHLPPNLCMVINQYVQMCTKKPQGVR